MFLLTTAVLPLVILILLMTVGRKFAHVTMPICSTRVIASWNSRSSSIEYHGLFHCWATTMLPAGMFSMAARVDRGGTGPGRQQFRQGQRREVRVVLRVHLGTAEIVIPVRSRVRHHRLLLYAAVSVYSVPADDFDF